MQKIIKKLYKLFHPSNLIVLLGAVFIILSMTYLIVLDKFNTPISYILYLVMAFAFAILVIKIYDILNYKINKFIDSKEILRKYRDDHILKYQVSLFTSLGLNVIYVLFKFISGIYFKSLWLISFAIYYFILVILRLNIAKNELKKKKSLVDEYTSYKRIGIILLFINLFLSIIILIIVNGETLKSYNTIVAISVAVYTFYLMINSIITLIKYRKYKSPLMTSAKVINVVTSMVSMLSLEIIMLSTFGPEKIDFNETMIMATGGGIAIIILGISLYMIIKSTEFLNNEMENSLDENN